MGFSDESRHLSLTTTPNIRMNTHEFFSLENARELQFFVYKEEENKFWLHIAEHHRLTLSWHEVVWNKNNQLNTHESRQSRIRDLGSLAPGEEGSTRFRAACWLRLQVPGTVIFCRTWLPNASHSETVAQAFNQSSHGVDPRVKKLRQRRQRSRNWKIAERNGTLETFGRKGMSDWRQWEKFAGEINKDLFV